MCFFGYGTPTKFHRKRLWKMVGLEVGRRCFLSIPVYRRYLFRGRTSCWTSGGYPTCNQGDPQPATKVTPNIAPPKQWEPICLKISRNSFMAPHSQQKRPWVFGLVVSLRNLNSPPIKSGSKQNMVLFFFGCFFRELWRRNRNFPWFSHDLVSFFRWRAESAEWFKPGCECGQKPRWDVNPYIASTGGVFFSPWQLDGLPEVDSFTNPEKSPKHSWSFFQRKGCQIHLWKHLEIWWWSSWFKVGNIVKSESCGPIFFTYPARQWKNVRHFTRK